MTADAPVSRDALFASLRTQWAESEAAVTRAAANFEAPGYEGWTVGDAFRHIVDSAHNTASDIRAMLASGEFTPPADERNAKGIAKFKALDAKMLPIEMDTAHGVVWMYIQRFSEEDLTKTYKVLGSDMSLGQLLWLYLQHETQHVADALKSAGVSHAARLGF